MLEHQKEDAKIMLTLTLVQFIVTLLQHLAAAGDLGAQSSPMGGALFSPLAEGVPNFICNIVTLMKPYIGGAIVLGLLAVAGGFALKFIAPQVGMMLTSALIGLGAAMFIAGIAITPASLSAISNIFGLAAGITFCQ